MRNWQRSVLALTCLCIPTPLWAPLMPSAPVIKQRPESPSRPAGSVAASCSQREQTLLDALNKQRSYSDLLVKRIAELEAGAKRP